MDRNPYILVLAVVTNVIAAGCTVHSEHSGTDKSQELRLHQQQWLASHNSFFDGEEMLATRFQEYTQLRLAEAIGYVEIDLEGSNYHPDIPTQIELGVRSFEFDLHGKDLAVFHGREEEDYTHCKTFAECLVQLKQDIQSQNVTEWVTVFIDPKPGQGVAWGPYIEAVHAAVEGNFPRAARIQPDDVLPVAQSAESGCAWTWPTVTEAAGKVSFVWMASRDFRQAYLDNVDEAERIFFPVVKNQDLVESNLSFEDASDQFKAIPIWNFENIRNYPDLVSTLVDQCYLIRAHADYRADRRTEEDLQAITEAGVHFVTTGVLYPLSDNPSIAAAINILDESQHANFIEAINQARAQRTYVGKLPEGGASRCNPRTGGDAGSGLVVQGKALCDASSPCASGGVCRPGMWLQGDKPYTHACTTAAGHFDPSLKNVSNDNTGWCDVSDGSADCADGLECRGTEVLMTQWAGVQVKHGVCCPAGQDCWQ